MKQTFIILTLVAVALMGCAEAPEEGEIISSGKDVSGNPARVILTADDLPTCNNETDGFLYYIIDLQEFQYCDGTDYHTINLNGTDGTDGTDGISINWLGYFDNESIPSSPNLNDAYYNTDNSTAYIWDGDSWEILVHNKTLKVKDGNGVVLGEFLGTSIDTDYILSPEGYFYAVKSNAGEISFYTDNIFYTNFDCSGNVAYVNVNTHSASRKRLLKNVDNGKYFQLDDNITQSVMTFSSFSNENGCTTQTVNNITVRKLEYVTDNGAVVGVPDNFVAPLIYYYE